MRIIDGKKFYGKDINAAIEVASKCNYNDQGTQWYTIKYHQPTGYCEIIANNSGDFYGDYRDRYYASPERMYRAEGWSINEYATMVGEIEETSEHATIKIDFMAHICRGAGKKLVDCPKSRELLGV